MAKARSSVSSTPKGPAGRRPANPDAVAKQQRNGLEAALIAISFIGSALGPRGSYKMMVDNFGNKVRPVMVTKDGYNALNRLEIEHPVAKVMREAAKAMHLTVGDGSISMLLLAGGLLRRAEALMQIEVHPSLIVDGYAKAEQKAEEIMDELAKEFNAEDRTSVLNLVRSVLETKLSEEEAVLLAPMVADAIDRVKVRNGKGWFIDPDQIDVITKTGGTMHDSQLINGIGLWREPTRYWMPYEVRDAKIAFIAEELEVRLALMSPLFKPEIQITDPRQMKVYKDEERRMLMDKIGFVLKTGANVIVSSKTYDDYVQVALGRLGILAIRRALDKDINRLAKATGANIIPECINITKDDLGYAGHIYVKNLQGDNWIFFDECKDPKAVSLLIRGSSQNTIEEAGSAIKSALLAVDRATRTPRVFPGGGALEAEIAQRLKNWAPTLHGKQQLAAMRYAEALESIPTMLAKSAGLNPLDALLKIRNAHATGSPWYGVDSKNRKLIDMEDSGVLDVFEVKEQMFKTATEVANTMIQVDGVYKKPKFVPTKRPAGPPERRVTKTVVDENYRPPAEVRKFMPNAAEFY